MGIYRRFWQISTPEATAVKQLDQKRLQILEALQQFTTADRESGECGPRRAIQVGQVMTRRPTCTAADTAVLSLVKLFHQNQYRHKCVTDPDGRLLGVISDRDVLRCFGPGKYPQQDILGKITAGEIMSADLITVEPECSIDCALDLLLEHGIGCLPVVSEGTLVGIVTTTDLHVFLQMLLQTLRSAPSGTPAFSAK